MSTPIISLFCGAGGLDLGFLKHGYRPILALDLNPTAVSTYNFNLGDSIAQVADLSELSGRDLINLLEERKMGESPRGVIGGPPCQSFSSGNAYIKTDDTRRALPRKYAAILKVLNERYRLDFFVFENVQGLASRRHTEQFTLFKKEFEEADFTVFEGLLDAASFCVPQKRPRIFLVGFNKPKFGDHEFQFPSPTTKNPRTVANAIRGLPRPKFFERNLTPEEIPLHPNHWAMRPKSEKFKNGFFKLGENKGKSFRVLSWNQPSYTVAYGHNEVHIHPSGKRRLSVYEAMLLQGFPPSYQILGTMTQQFRQVSDAVPPPLAAELARSIRKYLEEYRNSA